MWMIIFVVGVIMLMGLMNCAQILDKKDSDNPEVKAKKKVVVIGLIVTAFIFLLAFNVLFVEQKTLWNGGYCPHCNEHYELTTATRSYRSMATRFYWSCPKCKEVIEMLIKF